MLILENVKRIGNLITADYRLIGGSGGTVTYDASKADIIAGVNRNECGIGHMINLFRQMVKYDKYPEHIEAAWY